MGQNIQCSISKSPLFSLDFLLLALSYCCTHFFTAILSARGKNKGIVWLKVRLRKKVSQWKTERIWMGEREKKNCKGKRRQMTGITRGSIVRNNRWRLQKSILAYWKFCLPLSVKSHLHLSHELLFFFLYLFSFSPPQTLSSHLYKQLALHLLNTSI